MNNNLNYTTSISTSFYSSILFMALAKYFQEQETKVRFNSQSEECFDGQIRAKSLNLTDVLIPGYSFYECRDKAALSYYKLYKENPDFSKSDAFFSKINFLFENPNNNTKIYFSEDSVKLITFYRNKKFSINYDYGHDESLFVLNDDGKKMIIKECNVDSVRRTLESYFDLSERIAPAA